MTCSLFCRLLYKHVFRPILFLCDPEMVHNRAINFGEMLGKSTLAKKIIAFFFRRDYRSLNQEICGIHFSNPVGLAAGFDKNARLIDFLPALGFGFEEVGSVTAKPCSGNPKPRLWRLPRSKSLVIHYGLPNDGAQVILGRLEGRNFDCPVGINIAKTNSPETVKTDDAVEDYFETYRLFWEKEVGDYFTINISCPNAFGGEPFTDPEKLDLLLSRLFSLSKKKPVFVKLSPDLLESQLDRIIEIVAKYPVDGFIASNITKRRDSPMIHEKDLPPSGGLSGKAVEKLSDDLIRYLYMKTAATKIIIGCGGVFSAEDAYRKIKLGASLIQLITGMIYEGPQLVSEINRGLAKLLEEDGFNNIREAVGSDVG